MKIRGIVHSVLEDAPFVGAIVIAYDCYKNCHGCHNQHLRDLPEINISAKEIVEEVKSNPFNQGVILAGLEWTFFPEWLSELVFESLEHNLKVMIYTYLTEKEFTCRFKELCSLPIWVKFGAYDESKIVADNIQYGVHLATSNQYIKKFKE